MAKQPVTIEAATDVDHLRDQDVTHLRKVEHELIWLRRLALAGWAVMIVLQGYPLALSAVWAVYLGGVAYMVALHWLVRSDRSPARTAWFGALADPSLIFLMCWATGGIASSFVPFLYFTVIASAFRFGDRETLAMLGLHVLLVVALLPLSAPEQLTAARVFFVLFCLVFSAGLGRLMARWARENVETAQAQAAALRIERDHSRALLRKLIDVQEAERKQFAGDLHDRMGARLFSLQHGLDQCLASSGTDPGMTLALGNMREELVDCSADVRSLMNELRPTVLDELGLFEAVSEYVANLADHVPFEIETQIDPALKSWHSKQDAMLFRLIQEALLNVRKHAGAGKVSVRWQAVDCAVLLSIEDDGCGFNPADVPPGHYGILTMRERAEAAGGALRIDSAPAAGTRITVRFEGSAP